VQVNPPPAMAGPTPSSSTSLYSLVRTEYHQLQPKELPRQSPWMLLGVSLEVAALLKNSLENNTVFDLATSTVFNGATKIADAGGDMNLNVLFQVMVALLTFSSGCLLRSFETI
jgi:hypothetical protein